MHDFRVSLHRIAGFMALGISVLFWLGTIVVLVMGNEAFIAGMKLTILYGIMFQITALLVAAISGRLLSVDRMREPLVARKFRRMVAATALGLIVLLPAAVYLALKLQGAVPDMPWKLAQAVELVAQAMVIVLLMLNARDGLALHREGAAS